jgi:hypothetical protein
MFKNFTLTGLWKDRHEIKVFAAVREACYNGNQFCR